MKESTAHHLRRSDPINARNLRAVRECCYSLDVCISRGQPEQRIAMRLKMLMYVTIVCCWGKTVSIPQHILNELKANVLPLFGMKERPKLDEAPHVPEALQKLYDDSTNIEFATATLPIAGLNTRSANTVRSFVHVETPVDEKFISPHKFRLVFNISSIPNTEAFKAAEIKLTRESLPASQTAPYYRLLVHDILRRGVKGSYPPIMRVIDSQIIDTRQNSTISVDVSPAVQRWLMDPDTNYGVLVALHPPAKKAHKDKENLRHLRLKRHGERDADWLQKRPLLFTYTDDGRNKQMTTSEMAKIRLKRGAKKRKMEKDPCHRRFMYVDFRDVGWNDWIVAPQGYEAFYCAGQCDYPMPEHLNTTNHAIVQSLVNSVKPTEVPKPCCVPTDLSAISMLYVGSDGNVILKNYKDMVVEGCGCR